MNFFQLFHKRNLPIPGGAYSLGLGLVLATLALRALLLPGYQIPILVIFVPAILITATVGGLRSGLFATVIACACADYALIHPFLSWKVPTDDAAMDLASLGVTGIAVAVVCAILRSAIHQSEAAKADLTQALKLADQAAIEQKLAERALRESEEKFRSLIEQASDAVFLHDGEGRFLEVNRQACESLRYTREELLQMSVFDIETDVPASDLRRAWDESETGVPRTVEGRFRRKDASEFPVEARLGAYFLGGKKLQLALVRDISDRRQAELTLRTQANLLNQSFDAIILWEFDGVIKTWNGGAERLYGYSESEAVGQITHNLLSTTFPKPWSEIRDELIESGSWEGELRHRTRVGQEVIVSARKQLIRDASGVMHVLETNRDITERKQYEQHLRTMREELAHVGRLNEIGQVSAGIAHELNQPLAAMLNYANVAKRLIATREPATMEKAHEAIVKATEQAERAGLIIRRMRSFIEKRETHHAIEDINAIVRDSIDVALIGSHGHGITIDLHLHATPGLVDVDRLQIQQVLVNLIRNAAEAMSRSAHRVLSVSTQDNGDGRIDVSVKDTGPGLSKEVADRLFMPFITTKPGGMGIGLVISQSIVEAHGGQIAVLSHPGEGAEFRFSLPAHGE